MSDSVRTNAAGRFAHIDAMRAFAVMLVVVAHAGLGGVVPGGSGVTIFFSISGFIITLLLLKERERSGGFAVGDFYWRRALKIFPPFLVVVLLPSIALLLAGVPLSAEGLGSQVFFVFNWFYLASGTNIEVLAGSDVVWSLSIEEQFYIVFAVLWIVIVRWRRWKIATASLAGAAIVYATVVRVVLASAGPGASDRIYYGTDTRMDAIAFGALAAIAVATWTHRGERSSWVTKLLGSEGALIAWGAIYVGSLIIRDEWFRDTFRFTLQSIAAIGVIVYGMMRSSGWVHNAVMSFSSNRIVTLLGLASYSIYLAHLTAMDALSGLIDLVPTGWAQILARATVGTAAGIGIYFAVERPVALWRSRRKRLTAIERAGLDTGI
jgi:peptidoglycan/LPS O-acetylase OafA/YrhL